MPELNHMQHGPCRGVKLNVLKNDKGMEGVYFNCHFLSFITDRIPYSSSSCRMVGGTKIIFITENFDCTKDSKWPAVCTCKRNVPPFGRLMGQSGFVALGLSNLQQIAKVKLVCLYENRLPYPLWNPLHPSPHNTKL